MRVLYCRIRNDCWCNIFASFAVTNQMWKCYNSKYFCPDIENNENFTKPKVSILQYHITITFSWLKQCNIIRQGLNNHQIVVYTLEDFNTDLLLLWPFCLEIALKSTNILDVLFTLLSPKESYISWCAFKKHYDLCNRFSFTTSICIDNLFRAPTAYSVLLWISCTPPFFLLFHSQ